MWGVGRWIRILLPAFTKQVQTASLPCLAVEMRWDKASCWTSLLVARGSRGWSQTQPQDQSRAPQGECGSSCWRRALSTSSLPRRRALPASVAPKNLLSGAAPLGIGQGTTRDEHFHTRSPAPVSRADTERRPEPWSLNTFSSVSDVCLPFTTCRHVCSDSVCVAPPNLYVAALTRCWGRSGVFCTGHEDSLCVLTRTDPGRLLSAQTQDGVATHLQGLRPWGLKEPRDLCPRHLQTRLPFPAPLLTVGPNPGTWAPKSTSCVENLLVQEETGHLTSE